VATVFICYRREDAPATTGRIYDHLVQSFGDFIVGSNWLNTVGQEYGIGSGVHRAKVVMSEAAPTNISDDQVQAWLVQKIQSGTAVCPRISPRSCASSLLPRVQPKRPRSRNALRPVSPSLKTRRIGFYVGKGISSRAA